MPRECLRVPKAGRSPLGKRPRRAARSRVTRIRHKRPSSPVYATLAGSPPFIPFRHSRALDRPAWFTVGRGLQCRPASQKKMRPDAKHPPIHTVTLLVQKDLPSLVEARHWNNWRVSNWVFLVIFLDKPHGANVCLRRTLGSHPDLSVCCLNLRWCGATPIVRILKIGICAGIFRC